jgi:hypothetical protein
VRVIARSGLRALNLLACVDLALVQGVLGSPAMPFEMQHLLPYSLAACQDGGVDMPRPPAHDWGDMSKELVNFTQASREELFAELVVMMGFYAQAHEHNQESLNWGRCPAPLNRLCSTHFSYFSSPLGNAILLPTLLSICVDNARALGVVAEELSPLLLSAYLKRRTDADAANQAKRFPKRLWGRAVEFLQLAHEQDTAAAADAPAALF